MLRASASGIHNARGLLMIVATPPWDSASACAGHPSPSKPGRGSDLSPKSLCSVHRPHIPIQLNGDVRPRSHQVTVQEDPVPRPTKGVVGQGGHQAVLGWWWWAWFKIPGSEFSKCWHRIILIAFRGFSVQVQVMAIYQN